MCTVSMVMDYGRPFVPEPQQIWTSPGTTPIQPPKGVIDDSAITDPDELRDFIKSFRKLVKAAELFDEETGQHDCVDPEKQKLMDRIDELEDTLRVIRNMVDIQLDDDDE